MQIIVFVFWWVYALTTGLSSCSQCQIYRALAQTDSLVYPSSLQLPPMYIVHLLTVIFSTSDAASHLSQLPLCFTKRRA